MTKFKFICTHPKESYNTKKKKTKKQKKIRVCVWLLARGAPKQKKTGRAGCCLIPLDTADV